MDLKRKQALKSSAFILIIGVILIIIVFTAAPKNRTFSNAIVETPKDAADFMLELGWNTDHTQIEVIESVLPKQFDNVFQEYNALQLQQNCDLSQYAGKPIKVYTVPILNYGKTEQNVYATLIVHKSHVIGGDIHSAELNGFMHTLK